MPADVIAELAVHTGRAAFLLLVLLAVLGCLYWAFRLAVELVGLFIERSDRGGW